MEMPTTAPTMGPLYNDHSFTDFDITAQLNAYSESTTNSYNTPILQEEEEENNPHYDDYDDYDQQGDDYTDAANRIYGDASFNAFNYNRPVSGHNLFLREPGTMTLGLQNRKPSELPPALPEMMKQTWDGLSSAARAHYEGLAVSEQMQWKEMNMNSNQNTMDNNVGNNNINSQSAGVETLATMVTPTVENTNIAIMPPPLPLNNLIINNNPQVDSGTFPMPYQGGNNEINMILNNNTDTGFMTFNDNNNDNNNNNNNNNMSMPMPAPVAAPVAAPANNTVDLSFMTPSYKRAIADLASKLDEASIDFLIRAFK